MEFMNKDNFGLSKSFIDEMKADTIKIKKSTRMSLLGEFCSYCFYISEAIKNSLFYLKGLNLIKGDISVFFWFFTFTGFISVIGVAVNYYKVETILNDGKLSSYHKLILMSYLVYALYSNIFLPAFFVMFRNLA